MTKENEQVTSSGNGTAASATPPRVDLTEAEKGEIKALSDRLATRRAQLAGLVEDYEAKKAVIIADIERSKARLHERGTEMAQAHGLDPEAGWQLELTALFFFKPMAPRALAALAATGRVVPMGAPGAPDGPPAEPKPES